MLIKLSEGIAGMIRWLKLAISRDSLRLSITCVNVENCMMTTTDGFRIHRWNYRDADREVERVSDAVGLRALYGLENGLYRINMFGIVMEADLFYSSDPAAMKYPSTSTIWIPTMHKDVTYRSGSTVQLSIDPKFAKEAFSLPYVKNSLPTFMEFSQQFLLTYPAESHRTGGIAQALIMPMHPGYESAPVDLQPSQHEWDRVQNFRKDWHYDG